MWTLVWHLAAVVSFAAEADFDLGYRVNVEGTRTLLEALRATGRRPRLVAASSFAVYGGDLPPVVDDDLRLTPQTSYGAHKAIGELLVNDYSRKGYVDGRALRLPTIVVRTGKPNKAASTFASSIIREPLAGQEAVCPVGRDAAMYVLSPRRVVEAFLRAMRLPESAWGTNRTLPLPGISVTVGEMVAALARVAGPAVAGAGPLGTGPGDPAHRRRLAGRRVGAPGPGDGLHRRRVVRRHRPGPRRRRTGRPGPGAAMRRPSRRTRSVASGAGVTAPGNATWSRRSSPPRTAVHVHGDAERLSHKGP